VGIFSSSSPPPVAPAGTLRMPDFVVAGQTRASNDLTFMAVQSNDITLHSVITGQILDGGASLMDAHLPLEIQQLPAARGARTA